METGKQEGINFHSSGLRQKVDQLMDILWAGGVNNPMDSIEQLSYLLFLRLLSEKDELLASLDKKNYQRIFSGAWARYAWGNFVTLTGDELFDAARGAIEKLHELPGLSATGQLLFNRATLKIYDRPTLRAVIQAIHQMDLDPRSGQDLKGDMYEYLLSKISMSGTNGQFRTPRHIIAMIVALVNPKAGQRLCDPACGTAGFLIAAFNHILGENTSKASRARGACDGDLLKPAQWRFLEEQEFTGYDNDANMVKIAILNLYLHRLEKAGIELHNPLTTGKGSPYPGLTFDVVLANPPFAGKIQRESILADINLATRDTELLFLKWFIDHLNPGGRAGVIVPNGVLFGSNKADRKVRELLLTTCDLQAVVNLPSGVFKPYSGVGTAALIFQKGGTGFQPVKQHGQDAHATPLVPQHGQDAHATALIFQQGGTGFQPVKEHGQDAHATQLVPQHGQDAHATAHATAQATDGQAPLRIRQGAYLPHWTREGAIYAVNFRLADSLPRPVVEAWNFEREDIVKTARQMKRPLSETERKRLDKLFSERVERYLDEGQGKCWMRRDDVAAIVAGALQHFAGERYRLAAWCVMPNHVHAVLRPLPGHDLPDILHSWKSFSANEANKRIGRSGEFWQAESYDHLVRDDEDLTRQINYVLNNPVKAGLQGWKWVSRGTGSQPVQQQDGTGFQPVEQQGGTGFQPVKQQGGTGLQPVEQQGGTGLQPVEQQGTGFQPVKQHGPEAHVTPLVPQHGQDAHSKHGQDAHSKHGQDAYSRHGQDAYPKHGQDAHATTPGATTSVWFYDLTADGFSLDDKRTPIEANDIPDVLAKWPERKEGSNSYRVPIEKIRENDWSLAAGRYRLATVEAATHDQPSKILSEVIELEDQIVQAAKKLMAEVVK